MGRATALFLPSDELSCLCNPLAHYVSASLLMLDVCWAHVFAVSGDLIYVAFDEVPLCLSVNRAEVVPLQLTHVDVHFKRCVYRLWCCVRQPFLRVISGTEQFPLNPINLPQMKLSLSQSQVWCQCQSVYPTVETTSSPENTKLVQHLVNRCVQENSDGGLLINTTCCSVGPTVDHKL